jgi:hypothetical protein
MGGWGGGGGARGVAGARAAIFRPGLLDRGDKARLWEKVSMPVGDKSGKV